MASSTSKKFGLPGNNRLWIELIWNENVVGTTNTVAVKMVVHTQYMIAGTWTCRLKIDGTTVKEERVGMYWGSYSSGGSKEVLSYSKSFTYSGSKNITIEGAILNMDYYDIILGPGSITTSTLSHTATASLKTTNSAPPTPSIACTNSVVNGKYLAEDKVNITLGSVTDPQGDTVTYVAYAEYLPPGGKTWLNAGDANKAILYSTTNRNAVIDATKYARGTQFRVWGKAEDNHGASSALTNTISNIYRNKTPNPVTGLSPNGGIFNDSFTTKWSNPGDPDGNTPTFKIWVSKNGGQWTLEKNGVADTSYTKSLTADPEGTTYKLRICTTDGMTESSYFVSNDFKKNTKPTTPNYIFPNSGYALGNVVITWNASTDPDNRGISYYNVKINNTIVGTSKTTSYNWAIPISDAYNTEYRASIQAVDNDGKTSDWGTATGSFYKASPPSPPSWMKPLSDYHEDYIDLEWENISSNNVKVTYDLEYRLNQNQWITLATDLNINKYKHDISRFDRGSRIDYRVLCRNAFGQTSAHYYRQGYYRNRIPYAPKIIVPTNNSLLYDKSPRIAFSVQADPDNQEQVLYVKYNGVTYNSSSNKDMFSRKGAFAGTANVIFKASGLKVGENTIIAYTNDGLINSPETVIKLNIKESTLQAKQGDLISAKLFNSVREQINHTRVAYGFNNYAFNGTIVSGGAVKFDYITELRAAVVEARNYLNNFDASNSNLDVTTNWHAVVGDNYIFSEYIQQIIDIINNV